MQLKSERFYQWFNKLVFSLFYLQHQGKTMALINVRGGAQFKVRVHPGCYGDLGNLESKSVRRSAHSH